MAEQKHIYAYKAINDEGVTLTGDVEAESSEQASQTLLARGLMPTSITRQDSRFSVRAMISSWTALVSRVK